MSNLPAIPEPSTTPVPVLLDACEALVAWADTCVDLDDVREAYDRMAAIAEYLARQDHARTAQTAMRRIELRIGELIGPPTVGSHHSAAAEGSSLTRHQRHEFRSMAAHPDVVEHVIAESTEQAPASRSKVLEAIRNLEQVAREEAAKRAADKEWEASLSKPSPAALAEGRRRGEIHGLVDELVLAIKELTKVSPDDIVWALSTGLDYVAASLRAEAVEALQSLEPYREVFR